MTKLSQSTIEALGNYVYILIDPRNRKPFYVGKGKGNRINAHLMDATRDIFETEKLERIREIEKSGLKVLLEVVRYGLDESVAFEVESTLIDFIGKDQLTNKVMGHHTRMRGRMTIEELQILFEAQHATFDEPVLLININRLFRRRMSMEEVYEITRKSWKISRKQRESARIVCAECNGIIRGVFIDPIWTESSETEGRMQFQAKIASAKLLRKYLNHLVRPRKKGSQNPIRIVGV